MPKVETLRIRIPAREKNVTSFRKPAVLLESSIAEDTKPVKTDPTLSSPPENLKHPRVAISLPTPWIHESELDYSQPKDWDESRIIAYLFTNGFSIPARDTSSPWVIITGRDGGTTILPRGYRTPLLFVAKFQWESLRLVMNSASRIKEWEEYKYDILHVSRLCTGFLADARNAVPVVDRGWRSTMFDRALTRYYRHWLVNRPEFLKDFWTQYGDDEYARDVLKNDWTRFVLKGHKGFCITRDEIQKGISFEDLIEGLSFLRDCTAWADPPVGVRDGTEEISAPSLKARPALIRKEFVDPRIVSFWRFSRRARPIEEDFDLIRLGLHSPLPPPSARTNIDPIISQWTASHSLQIKREIMEEANILSNPSPPNHDPTLTIVQPALDQTQMQSDHAYAYPHTPLSIHLPDFPRRPQHFHPPQPHNRPLRLVPPAPDNFASHSVRRRSVAVQDPPILSPADVEMDGSGDPLDMVSNQQDANNERAELPFAASGDSYTVPRPGEGQPGGSAPSGGTRERPGFLWGKPGEPPTDVQMPVDRSVYTPSSSRPTRKPPAETSWLIPKSNSWGSWTNFSRGRGCNLDTTLRAYKPPTMPKWPDGGMPYAASSAVGQTHRLRKTRGARGCSDHHTIPTVNPPVSRQCNAPSQASEGEPSTIADTEGIRSHLTRNPIHTPVKFPTSTTGIRTTNSGSVVDTVVSMFRDTLGGLVDILEGVEQGTEKVTTPHHSIPSVQSAQPRSSLVTSSSYSSVTGVQQDTPLVGELLDEIKGLKRQMKDNADRASERNADMKRLRAQMDDLHRTVIRRGSRGQVSTCGVSMEPQKALSSSSIGCATWDRTDRARSQHPLAHLFSMEADFLASETSHSSPTPIEAEKQQISSTQDLMGSQRDHRPLLPSTGSSLRCGSPKPDDSAPLPIKSQRKHRMLFPDHQQN